MRGRSLRKHLCFAAFTMVFLMLFTACERNNYELLDPASAGQWTYFTTVEGLPGNRVTDIQLDSKNNLWFTFPGQGTANSIILHGHIIKQEPRLCLVILSIALLNLPTER